MTTDIRARRIRFSYPEGEDFFVRSVKHYRDQVTDPVLSKQIAGFIGQAGHPRPRAPRDQRAARRHGVPDDGV